LTNQKPWDDIIEQSGFKNQQFGSISLLNTIIDTGKQYNNTKNLIKRRAEQIYEDSESITVSPSTTKKQNV